MADMYKQIIRQMRENSLKIYEEDKRILSDFENDFSKAFQNLVIKLKKVIPNLNNRKEVKDRLKNLHLINNFEKKFLLEEQDSKVKNIFFKLLMNEIDTDKVYKKLLRKALENKMLDIVEKQRPSEDLFPKEFYKLLPPYITFEVDINGYLKSHMQHFNVKTENLEEKLYRLSELAKSFSDLDKRLRKDLKSGNETIKIRALMALIIMQTGLRPGREGNKIKIKDENGKVVDIPTYGLTTIKKKHLNIIRDNVAKIKFRGKKGTENISELTDKELIKILKDITKNKSAEDKVFVTKNGKQVSYDSLDDYLRKLTNGRFNLLDFRRFVASLTVYEKLKESCKDLYMEIREAKTKSKNEINKILVKKISAIFESAKNKLNHEDVKTTISNYITPYIVLKFLSNAGLDDTIEKALDKGVNFKLKINTEMFIKKAFNKLASKLLEVIFKPSKGNGLEDIEDKLVDIYNSIQIK